MFNAPVTGAFSLPSRKDMAAVKLSSIIQANPLTPALVDSLLMPPAILRQLQRAWDKFKGPVRKPDNFKVMVYLHQSKHGWVECGIRWHDGELSVEVAVTPETPEYNDNNAMDDDPFEDVFESYVGTPRPTNSEDQKFLEEIWEPVGPAVETITRDPQVRANDPCPCGKKNARGKIVKFKRCCGR